MGTLTSWNPLGHSRPVTGLLYLFMMDVLCNSGNENVLRIGIPVTPLISVRKFCEVMWNGIVFFYLRRKRRTTKFLVAWGGIWTAGGCAMDSGLRNIGVEPSDSLTSVLFNNLIGTRKQYKYRNTLQDVFYCAFDLGIECSNLKYLSSRRDWRKTSHYCT